MSEILFGLAAVIGFIALAVAAVIWLALIADYCAHKDHHWEHRND